MRLRPHLGTVLFPPVALLYLPLLLRNGLDRDLLGLILVVVLLVFAILAVISWRFLRGYPTLGVFFSACLALMFPFTQSVTTDDAFEALFGSTSVLGLVGVIYFGARGIRAGSDGQRAQPRGFAVIPEARRTEDVTPP